MPIRAVLFDFDGTLADSYRSITASVNHVRALRGLPPLMVEEVRPKVGRGLPSLLQSCVPGSEFDLDASRYREHHPTVLVSGTTLLPGAVELLCHLHERGLKLGVCSNKPRPFTQLLLRTLTIADYFSLVLGPEDVAHPKPAPEMLIEAKARLGLPGDEVLYVGDMTVDITTARGAGVPVWVVATGSDTAADLLAAFPDRFFENLADLQADLLASL